LNDQGFTLELSLKMTYEQLVALVAQHLNTDKKLIQMFKVRLELFLVLAKFPLGVGVFFTGTHFMPLRPKETP
jgi:hypothetical protein